jgi:Pyridoxamine 5'-phosphate oxidase
VRTHASEVVNFIPASRHRCHELTRHQCMARLRENRWGRLAYSEHALPAITPVPYRLVREEIVYPLDWVPHAVHPALDAVVAFEIDGPSEGGPAWSVVVVGWTTAFTEPGSTLDSSYCKITPNVVIGHQYVQESSWEPSM